MNQEQRLQALEARLQYAEDRLALMDLEAEYARSWDAADAAAWANLFTEDGVFDMAGVGHQARRVYEGTAQLAGFCQEVSAFYQGLHFMHLPRLQLQGDTAVARVHFQWTGVFHASPHFHGQRTAQGYYDVTYRRAGDGRWRILHRIEKAITGSVQEQFDVYLQPQAQPQTQPHAQPHRGAMASAPTVSA